MRSVATAGIQEEGVTKTCVVGRGTPTAPLPFWMGEI